MFDSHAHYSIGTIATSLNYPALDVCVDPFYFSTSSFNLIHAVGFHPLYLPADNQFTPSMAHLEMLIHSKSLIAIGEIGLDARLVNSSLQQQFFQAQWEMACEYDLPISIHLVKSTQVFQRALKSLPKQQFIIHGFSGQIDLARWVVAQGGFIGIGTQLLNPSNKKLLRVVKELPIESMLVETDWPFVSHQLKMKSNPHEILARITSKIARIKKLNWQETDKILTLNAIHFFRLDDV